MSEPCAVCYGSGEVDLIDRRVEACPACVSRELHQKIAALEAKLDACECTNKELDRELRQERGLKALLANGMPPTGNEDFDKVLATYPIAAIIQRGWLPGITGFDDLLALESAICHFLKVKTIAEAVDLQFAINPPQQGKDAA